jgi:hypothetical protein
MARRHKKTMAATIFENVLFLEEVFGYKDDADIPEHDRNLGRFGNNRASEFTESPK